MPAVTTPGTFTAGAVVSATNYNNNMYGTSGSVGLFRGKNGGLDSANLSSSPAFTVQKDIIQPKGVIFPSWTPMQVYPVDYVNEYMGSTNADEYVQISGPTHRFYLPYTCTWIFYSINITVDQYLIGSTLDQSALDVEATLSIMVNGLRVPSCDTPLHNVSYNGDTNATGAYRLGSRQTNHYSFEVMSPCAEVSLSNAAGYKSVQARIAIAKTNHTVSFGTRVTDEEGSTTSVTYNIYGRVSAFNRQGAIMGCK